MNKNQLMLVVLSITLAIGVFMPLVKAPFIGEINYFKNGGGDGVYLLVCAAIACILSLSRYRKLVVVPGLIASLILINFYVNYEDAYRQVRGISTQEMGIFSSLGEALKSSVSISYGFIVMTIAALGLTFMPLLLSENENSVQERNPA